MKSRYSNTKILDGKHYATFAIQNRTKGYSSQDILQGVETFEHVVSAGERMDHLAARYFNEDQYWWVIALVNDISYPFASGGFIPGKKLRIPVDVKDVLDRILD